MSTFPEEWVSVFAQLGSDERLSIMIVLHGSDYLRHTHLDMESDAPGQCLSFSQILEATGIESDTRLSYHLSRLIDGDLVKKIAFKDSKGRVFPLYKPTSKWISFASELKIDEKIKIFLHSKYPSNYIEK